METTIAFRVTSTEAKAIESQADRFGISPGQYAKLLALADAELPLPVVRRGLPRDAVALRKLAGNLGKVGSNLNQLARAANAHFEVDAEQLAQALEELAAMRSALVAVLRVRDP